MKAIHSPFTKIINGTTQFVVSVFQRDYRWSEGQCEQLWNDILLIARDRTPRQHFLGSVVYDSADGQTVGIKSFERSSVRIDPFADDFRHVGLVP